MRQKDTFICAACGREFLKGRTDQEADNERENRFPGISREHCSLVCEQCYMALAPPLME